MPETMPEQVPFPPGPANPSPDGERLAYLQRDAEGIVRLWLAPVSGDLPRMLPLDLLLVEDEPDEDAVGPQWSPDGRLLAVVAAGFLSSGGGNKTAIWLVDVDGAEPRSLVEHPASDRAPCWSPDGTRVAFVSRRDGRDLLCMAPVDGSGPAIALTDELYDAREPAWSSDGTLLAFCRVVASDPFHSESDICVVDVASGAVRQLTEDTPAGRRSPRWAPTRPLVAYVTDEGAWANIAVVNAENEAGWMLADEPGDKADPRWATDSEQVVYTRTRGVYVECCERGLTAAEAYTVDPGGGVARCPRWLPDGRIAYAFATPQRPFQFLLQAPSADAERVELPPALPWQGPEPPLLEPQPLEVTIGRDERVAGLLYRRREASGPVPAVVFLDDGPPGHRGAAPREPEQTLATTGLAVFTPNLHGALGFGRAVADGLREQAESEVEVADLTDAASTLRELDGIDGNRLAVAGHGYGGLVALLAAGARPGVYQAAVAVDPIVDWNRELDQATGAWRRWLLAQFGLPAVQRARYAPRTPTTFAALIDVPLLLIETATSPPGRRTQLASLIALLREAGVAFDHQTVDEPSTETWRRAAEFLQRHFLAATTVRGNNLGTQ